MAIKQSQRVVYQTFERKRSFTNAKLEQLHIGIEDFESLDDKSVGRLLTCFMPIFRLGPGSYLIGVESKQILNRGTKCMVRVGGGFVTMEEYYKKYATK